MGTTLARGTILGGTIGLNRMKIGVESKKVKIKWLKDRQIRAVISNQRQFKRHVSTS